jgi:hypothetical protein
MEITAVGLPALPIVWEGKVHSVFQNSCNIQTDYGSLVTLHRFDFGMLPHSLYAPELSTANWRQGDQVRADQTGLRIGEQTLVWAQEVRQENTKISVREELPSELEQAWCLLRNKQKTFQNHPMVEEIYRRLYQAIQQLWEGLRCGDREEVSFQCKACIGLGLGLTPSGDDMLLGTLTILHMYRPDWAELLGKEILPHTTRTNDISRNYLELAVRGYAATPVIRAAEQLHNNKAVELLLSVGHSSGCDILEGMLTTVQNIRAKKEERKEVKT